MTLSYKVLITSIVILSFLLVSCAKEEIREITVLDKTGTMWAPYLEWRLENKSYSGNPFDVIAKVRFKNKNSQKEHITEMFYAGNDIWKFRFTGTEIGEWSFITSSDDPDLNNTTGNIIIKENNNLKIKGFLTHKKNQFAIWTGNKPVLSAYRFMVYMNGTKFYSFDGELRSKDSSESPFFTFHDLNKIQSFIDEADKNGFEIVFLLPGHPHVWTDGSTVSNGKNPRLDTFNILEKAITHAHSQGKRVHLWMWGDQSRRATPIPLEGGVNGIVDKRLQRYIAARLGPLPGWSMGYGFDLHEWTNHKKIDEWASYLHKHFGWDHLLAARGFNLKGKNNINSYDGFGRNVPLYTTSHGPQDYFEIVEDMKSDTSRPHLYEERHSYLRPNFKVDMDGTRRLIWWEMMAGGMGGWFGFYPTDARSFQGYPYPKPEQLRTAKQFWDKFYVLNMEPMFINDNYVLISSNKLQMIIYAEDTDLVKFDLAKFDGKLNAIAVDTKNDYKEIILNLLNEENQSWKAPYNSDWVISVRHN